MRITYSSKSRISAEFLGDALENIGIDVELNRGRTGDINWGRGQADTELNPDISNVTNKRVMRELFASHDVPMPKLYSTWPNIEYDTDWPILVGRPDQHSKGRGFWRCETPRDIAKALRGRTYRNGKHKKAATHFMEYIEAGREYRVHIFKGKSIRISEKDFSETGETSTGQYVTRRPNHNIKHVRRAAKQAIKAVGLDFGAVDILTKGDDNEEVFVLEVNAAPHLGGSLPQVYARKIKEYFDES